VKALGRLLVLVALSSGWGLTQPAFEVASIKPANPNADGTSKPVALVEGIGASNYCRKEWQNLLRINDAASLPLHFSGKSYLSSFLADRSGELVCDHNTQDLTPWNQKADRPRDGIRLLLVRRQIDPDASGVIRIEHRGKQYVTLINSANLNLWVVMLSKKHLYTMKVHPRPFDHNRYAGPFINLHRIVLAFPFLCYSRGLAARLRHR
jgi:hypothetical protein